MKRTWMAKFWIAVLPFEAFLCVEGGGTALSGGRLQTVEIRTSVQKSAIEFIAGTEGLDPSRMYRLRAEVDGPGNPRKFLSEALRPDGAGRLCFSSTWREALLWDTDSPQNRYRATVILSDADGRRLDVSNPVPFGFREFRFQGRGIFLNGSGIHLRAFRNDSLASGPDRFCAASLRERFLRLRKLGFNAFYAEDASFFLNGFENAEALLSVCDETGMLLVVPHTGKRMDVLRNHPAVLAYPREAVDTVAVNPGWGSCQERGDRYERWAGTGDKPLFVLETGLPRLSPPSGAEANALAVEYAAQVGGAGVWETGGAVADLQRACLTEELRGHRTYHVALQVFSTPFDEETFLRWNQPECSFLAGPAEAFTEKDHHYVPGGQIRKSIVLLNDHRRTMNVRWSWRVTDPGRDGAEIVPPRHGSLLLPPGGRMFVPIVFRLSEHIAKRCRRLRIESECAFANGVEQRDSFDLCVVHDTPPTLGDDAAVFLYDPVGLTAAFLERNRIPYRVYEPAADLPPAGVLVIGREAVGVNGLPWFAALPKGRRVLFFEQQAEILERVFGFRVQERATRHFFIRCAHPVTDGLTDENFRDWRELSTLLTPRVRASWCGFPRLQRQRPAARGAVASVLIEKPAKGDWLALLDGGFGLQYTPLLAHREAGGLYLFCQLDVTGRTLPDPVADLVAVRCLAYLTQSRPGEEETVVSHLGNPACEKWLRDFHLRPKPFTQETSLLLAGKGDPAPAALDVQVEEGLNVLCLGMGEDEIRRWSPVSLPQETTGEPDGALRDLGQGGVAIALVRHGKGRMVFWRPPFDGHDETSSVLRRLERRRANVTFGRLLANFGVTVQTPLENLLANPERKAWLRSYYVDEPRDADDPYR